MLGSDRGRLIEEPYDNTADLQPFYDALHARIAAHEQSAAAAGPPLSKPNATTFAPNVGGSPLNYEDPYQRGGESQHPGTGIESILPYQAQGISQEGNPYQRNQDASANSPFMSWEGAPPFGTNREDMLSKLSPPRDQMANLYARIRQQLKLMGKI